MALTGKAPKGRGGNRGSKNKNFASSGVKKKKKSIDDYMFYLGSSKQASDYKAMETYMQ